MFVDCPRCRLGLLLSRSRTSNEQLLLWFFLPITTLHPGGCEIDLYQIISYRINIFLLLLVSMLRFLNIYFTTCIYKTVLPILITLLPKCIVQMPKSTRAIADHIIDAYTFTILVTFIIETDCFVKSFEIPRP